jgi:RimJ/RimL family protein N-acetyltransferase
MAPPSALFLFQEFEIMMSAALKTDRLILRKPCNGDAGRIVELINNWNVASWLAKAPYPYSLSDAEDFLARVETHETTVCDAVYAITSDQMLIGVISVSPQSLGPNLGYWLGEPYWSQGLVTEAAGAVIAEFFRQPDNSALVSGIFRGNDASLAIQRKFGFEVTEEKLVKCVARGEMAEHVCTILTRQRFKELQL